jgi:hypothetical protein
MARNGDGGGIVLYRVHGGELDACRRWIASLWARGGTCAPSLHPRLHARPSTHAPPAHMAERDGFSLSLPMGRANGYEDMFSCTYYTHVLRCYCIWVEHYETSTR